MCLWCKKGSPGEVTSYLGGKTTLDLWGALDSGCLLTITMETGVAWGVACFGLLTGFPCLSDYWRKQGFALAHSGCIVVKVGFRAGRLGFSGPLTENRTQYGAHTRFRVWLTCKCDRRWPMLFAFLPWAQRRHDWCSWCVLPSPRQHRKQ